MNKEMQMVRRVTTVERVAVLVSELRCELTQLTFARMRLERNINIDRVGGLVIPSAYPFVMVKRVLVMT